MTFLEKVTFGGPGVDFLGKVEVENREKWGKNKDLRNKPSILPPFDPWGPPDPALDFLEKWGVGTPKMR